jgi:hypothetical protein
MVSVRKHPFLSTAYSRLFRCLSIIFVLQSDVETIIDRMRNRKGVEG